MPVTDVASDKIFPVTHHPEARGDEVFLGNFSGENYGQCGWGTKRTGSTAYDIYGAPINDPDEPFFPVFVKRQEIIDAGFTLDDTPKE